MLLLLSFRYSYRSLLVWPRRRYFSSQKSTLSYHSFLLCPCFVLYGHSTVRRPYIRVRVTLLSHEFGMFAMPASLRLPSFLFVVLTPFHYLRLLPYALSPPRTNLPMLRCALLCSTLSVAVRSKLPSLRARVGHSTDITVTVSDGCRTQKPEDGSSR